MCRIVIVASALVLAVSVIILYPKEKHMSELVIAAGIASSSDPLDFDEISHHITMPSLLGTLVTDGRKGQTLGLIAETWSSNTGLDVWTFTLRQNLRFSNGDKIDTNAVYMAYRRLILSLKKRGSMHHAFIDLVGYEGVDLSSGEIAGLMIDGNDLVLKFTRPQPRLLEDLSFGLYSVPHPTSYDANTGEWAVSVADTISSSFYSVSKMNDKELELTLRSDFLSNLWADEIFERLKFVWGAGREYDGADVFLRYKEDLGLNNDAFVFTAPFNQAEILYARILSFNQHGVLSDKENRRILRDLTYKKLGVQKSDKISFVAPAHLPVDFNFPAPDGAVVKNIFNGETLKIRKWETKTVGDKFYAALEQAAKELGAEVMAVDEIPYGEVKVQLDANLKKYSVDINCWLTGLGYSEPREVLRFMVKSAEGIRLPDPTGRLSATVSKSNFENEEFERLLNDDAIIWPIMRLTYGLYYRHQKVDLSNLNYTSFTPHWAFAGLK